jgi:hypothetical protein
MASLKSFFVNLLSSLPQNITQDASLGMDASLSGQQPLGAVGYEGMAMAMVTPQAKLPPHAKRQNANGFIGYTYNSGSCTILRISRSKTRG